MPGKLKRNIRHLSVEELGKFFSEHDEKPFHAKQVDKWLWVKGAGSFAEMTDLSTSTRQLLEENFFVGFLQTADILTSSDKTVKYMFCFGDGTLAEGVLIPSGGRTTACISTQSGCPLGCRFCATAKLGLKRNLEFDEIFDQVSFISKQSQRIYGKPISNLVVMGMGEPLLNDKNTLKAIEKITSPDGLNMSPQRITVSTAGIPEKIKQLANDNARFQLALSLHSANDNKRNLIMPINKAYPLKSLTEAIKYYHDKTGNRVTIEYIPFNNFNDSMQDAGELLKFCRNFPVKINLIEYNAVEGSEFTGSPMEKIVAFKEYLESKNLVVNIRHSRGRDIHAACGQLANHQSKSI